MFKTKIAVSLVISVETKSNHKQRSKQDEEYKLFLSKE